MTNKTSNHSTSVISRCRRQNKQTREKNRSHIFETSLENVFEKFRKCGPRSQTDRKTLLERLQCQGKIDSLYVCSLRMEVGVRLTADAGWDIVGDRLIAMSGGRRNDPSPVKRSRE